MAVEKAKLAQNIYGRAGQPINALESMPDVPEGWVDISNDENALSSLGLKREMLFDESVDPNFFSRVYAPDKYVFGDDMNPTVVFRGTRPDKMADWGNNFAQGAGFNSSYYEKAVNIGRMIAENASKIDIAGHSLGGGLASAAGMASGQQTWTFNAAGLNHDTVEKYGAQLMGDGSAISAYRVNGEMLTKIQEASIEDLADANFDTSLFALKAGVSNMFPNAIGKPTGLAGGTGSMLDKHGMVQVIDCIEAQKDEDIGIIKSRVLHEKTRIRDAFFFSVCFFIGV
ncbi:phospholipase [Kosakonia sacchari]|uniref:phospholipase n=1 Tax=Kosakonia TaxID=1330547 RepID=UPI0030BCDCCA